ncbi:MmyB family transcriptional regulator [Mycobacterium sp. HM-7]
MTNVFDRRRAAHHATLEHVSVLVNAYRTTWPFRHDGTPHIRAGTKRFHDPDVGELVLAYDELAITAEPGHVPVAYPAGPGSRRQKTPLLASPAATRV